MGARRRRLGRSTPYSLLFPASGVLSVSAGEVQRRSGTLTFSVGTFLTVTRINRSGADRNDAIKHVVAEPSPAGHRAESPGLAPAAYRDCVGVWTIGYGHTS